MIVCRLLLVITAYKVVMNSAKEKNFKKRVVPIIKKTRRIFLV